VHILAGDIGGTSTRLQIAVCDGDACRPLREQRFASADFTGLSAVLREFLQDAPAIDIRAACFGIAGPIQQTGAGQFVKVTNLPWQLESDALAREFGIAKVLLINDFQAIGYAIERLAPEQLCVVQQGEPLMHGPRAVLGAGTGLGQALLVWQGEHYEVIATEGGHADFGPTDELTVDLSRYLLAHFGHASYEKILSGVGLVRLYSFLRERGAAPESAAIARALCDGDPAAVVTHAALQQGDPLANRALDLFVQIYGAQAGNLALTAGATGGIYIAGGIAPRIVSRLASDIFLRAFRNKGAMSSWASRIPVQVVMEPEPGLAGALALASLL
jgi:glucokinase